MAGKPTRKCGYCSLDDTKKEDMVVVIKEGKKVTYKYYHDYCYPKYEEKQKFLDKEREELDHLTKVIMRIYGAKILPNSIYPMLQDLRNGNKFYGKKDNYYKKGYSYKVIADTFEYVSESIDYANANKNFAGFGQAFRYGLAIVCDKLMVVEDRNKNEKQQEVMIQARLEKAEPESNYFESNYKKKKDTVDISEFLDD